MPQIQQAKAAKEFAENPNKYFGIGNRHLGRYIDKNIEYHGYIWETNK